MLHKIVLDFKIPLKALLLVFKCQVYQGTEDFFLKLRCSPSFFFPEVWAYGTINKNGLDGHYTFQIQNTEFGKWPRFPVEGLEKRMDKASKQLAESRKIIPVESNGNALNTSRWLYYKYLGNLNELPLVHRTMLPNEWSFCIKLIPVRHLVFLTFRRVYSASKVY